MIKAGLGRRVRVNGSMSRSVSRWFCACRDGKERKEREAFWNDKEVWKRSGKNTSVCLLGCSLGEFSTLYAYSFFQVNEMTLSNPQYYALLGLPLVNGLLTSVALETSILKRQGMNLRNAFHTAMGMSFISMLVMEVSMEIVDLSFTCGSLAMDTRAVPFMLTAGFLAPLPYNYYQLKRHGRSCH